MQCSKDLSITSSARPSSGSGTVRPSALVAYDAATSSNLPLVLKHIIYFATHGLVAGEITSPSLARRLQERLCKREPECELLSPGLTLIRRVLFDFRRPKEHCDTAG
jgi:hypothetical protein